MTPVIKSVELPDRVRLPYVEQGGPSGVPILLLHGVTDSIHAFALTQRGHGDADRPAAGYRTRDFEADVAAFADAVGLASAVVVGHSMGITNAQRFAIDHPERTQGLVLAGSFAKLNCRRTWLDRYTSRSTPMAGG